MFTVIEFPIVKMTVTCFLVLEIQTKQNDKKKGEGGGECKRVSVNNLTDTVIFDDIITKWRKGLAIHVRLMYMDQYKAWS